MIKRGQALFLAAALLLVTGVAGRAEAQNYRYGVHTYYLSPYLAEKSRDLGIGFVRIQIDWDAIQPDSPNDWNDTQLQSWLATARAQHLKLYATLMGTPRWAGSCSNCMPDDMWAWYDFVYRVMANARAAYPDVEMVFGIWNEPNLTGPGGFFQGNDKDYSLLFQYASLARDAASPNARLAAPELSVGGVGPLIFLDAALKQIAPYFRERDIVTFHWYPGQGELTDWVKAIGSMVQGHEIWLTETGNNTCNDTDQRASLDYVINTFDFRNPSPLWTKVFVYYLWDAYTNCAANLVRSDGSNRPAYVDYRNRASGTSIRQRGTTLRASNGKFVSADEGGNGRLVANRRAAGSWETFDLVDLNGGGLMDGDKVALQTANGLYLQADQGGGGILSATGISPGAWDTFTIVALRHAGDPVTSGDTIALRSDRGFFVSADVAGTETLTAGRTSVGAWETFEFSELARQAP